MTARRPRLPAPRWQTPLPEGVVGSWGPGVEAWARATLRIELDLWQRRVLNRALVYGEDGELLHRMFLVSTARQNGKTAIVRALVGWALTARDTPQWATMIGLAHDKKQARIPYKAVRLDLAPLSKRYGKSPDRGGLSLTTYLGIRSGLYGRHREYDYASREARDAIRGESVDLVLFDEVRTQRDFETWAAVEPLTTARPEPLVFAISTAGNDRSVLLREWWERGVRIIEGAEPMGTFGMTWYAAPDHLPPDDPRAWRAASPSLAEGRLDVAVIRESFLSFRNQPAAFRAERLNLWAESVDEWLPAGTWKAREAAQPGEVHPRTILSVEVVPSWRRATIAVAVPTELGAWVGLAAELVPVTGSIAPADLIARLAEVAALWRPAAVAYSVAAPAAPHVEAWAERADVSTVKLGARELRAASALFRSELVGGRLTHAADPLLALQSRQARPSAPIEGGDWYLSIRESTGDIDAVRAAAWAAWAAIAPPEAERALQVFV